MSELKIKQFFTGKRSRQLFKTTLADWPVCRNLASLILESLNDVLFIFSYPFALKMFPADSTILHSTQPLNLIFNQF